MTDSELELLLCDVESDRTERKQSLPDSDKIREAICAFANDLPNHQLPGVLFIGAKDDGSCAGLPITEQLLLTLADMRSDGNILPFPMMSVQKRTLSGCDMAAVVVEPADAPPVRCKGRIWIRVGPRRAIATHQEELRLTEKRRAKEAPFDIHCLALATVDDLDLDLFRRSYLPASVAPEVIEENQRTDEEQLASLRLLSRHSGQWAPTVLGVLTVGKDPLGFVPGAYIQFLRLDGLELSDPVKDAADISGPLPEMLRRVEEKLKAHLETAREFASTPVDVARPDYPMAALQQIVRNAILHRTYEGTHAPVRIYWFADRIEIHSPGGPFGQVTKTNFGNPGITDYRNPHLAEAMKNLGYVQKFGVGIELARKELAKNRNPALEFQVEDTRVLAVIRRRQ